MNASIRRGLIGGVIPLVPFAALSVAFATWWDRLPDPLASHWGFGGEPNDSLGRTAFAVLMLGAVAISGLSAAWVSRRPDAQPTHLSVPIVLATFLEWTLVLIAGAALIANLDAAGWQNADELPVPLSFVMVVPAALVAAGVGSIARTLEQPTAVLGQTPSSVGLVAGERAAWIGTVRVMWPVYLGGAMSIVGILMIVTAGLGPALLLVVASAMVMAFASVRVTADRSGLAIAYGPFGWPRTRIALDRIERVTVIEVPRGSHGGWGYRGSLRLMGKAALVLRSGEAIQVDLQDGKQFIVTIDGAEAAAGTLNDLSARQHHAHA